MGLFDDATRRAARRQLDAMGGQAFRLEIRNERGETRYESLTRAELLGETNRLRRENRAGAAIGIRSEERTGLVLVRGLDEAGLERMGRDKLLAALVTHVGEHRFEAWVRLDPAGFGKGYHDALAQVLADRYAIAPQPAGWDTYGRLAGFAHPERHDDAFIDRRDAALARLDAQGRPLDDRRAEFIALLQTMRADPAFSDQDALALLARTGTRGQGQQGLPADPEAYAQQTVQAVRRALAANRGPGRRATHGRAQQEIPGR